MTERRIFTMAQQVASALVSMLMFVLTLCGRHVWLVNHCHKLFAHIHHFRIRPGVQSSSVSCLVPKCRSSFTAKIFFTETSAPVVCWSPGNTQPSFGAYMASSRGRTRQPLREMIPVWRNGRHQSFWPKGPPVRAVTCEFVVKLYSLLQKQRLIITCMLLTKGLSSICLCVPSAGHLASYCMKWQLWVSSISTFDQKKYINATVCHETLIPYSYIYLLTRRSSFRRNLS